MIDCAAYMCLTKFLSNSELITTSLMRPGMNSALGLKWHSLSDKFLFEGIDVETKLAITKMVVV